MAGSITLRVITPERVALDTTATSVQFTATDGLMGVLPRHAHMVAALGPGPLRYKDGAGQAQETFVAGGFAEVRDDTLRIVADAYERPTDIDVERAKAAAQRARERLRSGRTESGSPVDTERAHAALLRALTRQRLAGRG